MSDKQVAMNDEATSALQSAAMDYIKTAMGQVIAEQVRVGVSGITKSIEALREEVTSMRTDLKKLQNKVDDLSDRADRQDKRLAAIETFPPFPMSQPPRYYATESHSVSMAQRVRLSHLG